MAPGDSVLARLDPSVLAYRRLLAEAEVSDEARAEALMGLARRTVFAATWPASPSELRTVENRDGDEALVLFTALDTLRAVADGFGWGTLGAGLSWRELGAREALRVAIKRNVPFLVLDLGAAHAVEFVRQEIEALVSARAMTLSDSPAAGNALVRKAVRRSARPPRSHRRYEVVAGPPPSVSSVAAMASVARGRSVDGIAEADTDEHGGTVRLRRRPGERTGEQAFPRGERVRELATVPPRSGDTARPPAASPSAPDQVPQRRLRASGGGVRRDTVAEERALKAALKAPPTPIETARTAPSLDLDETRPAHGGGDDAMSSDEVRAQAQPQPEPASASSPDSRGRAQARSGNGKALLAAPEESLGEEVLSRVAEQLRRYPEVDWACELADKRGRHVLGLRVDPSFMTRVAEISEVVIDASGSDALSVLLLTDVQATRDARKHGNIFFPWRDRPSR